MFRCRCRCLPDGVTLGRGVAWALCPRVNRLHRHRFKNVYTFVALFFAGLRPRFPHVKLLHVRSEPCLMKTFEVMVPSSRHTSRSKQQGVPVVETYSHRSLFCSYSPPGVQILTKLPPPPPSFLSLPLLLLLPCPHVLLLSAVQEPAHYRAPCHWARSDLPMKESARSVWERTDLNTIESARSVWARTDLHTIEAGQARRYAR